MTGLLQGALWYTISGVVVLAALWVFTWVRQRKKEKDTFLRDVMAALEPPRPKWVKRLKTAGLLVVILALWPLAVGILLSEFFKDYRRSQIPERKVDPEDMFYAKGNLLEEVTCADAESREHYVDPMGLVPALPFGHLHHGWKVFLGRKPQGDARLWAFHRKADDQKHWSYDRANGPARGYCWVVDGKVVAEIVVES